MPKMRNSRRTLIALLPVFLIVSACSDDDSTPQAATDAPPPATAAMRGELNALLPDDIREAGVIKTGGPVTDPPTMNSGQMLLDDSHNNNRVLWSTFMHPPMISRKNRIMALTILRSK
jgi:hypothetical protein